MNENLNELIQQTPADEAMKFDVNNLDLTTEENQEEPGQEEQQVEAAQETQAEETQAEVATNQIPIVCLGDWYRTYSAVLTNIHQCRTDVIGVVSEEYLLVSIDDPEGIEVSEGVRKRSLKLFDDALTQSVLNLEPSDMQIYKNSFKVIYPIDENTFIKVYAVKTGLITMFCHALEGGLFPYAKVVAKRKDEFVEVQTHDVELYRQQLTEPVNMETIHLLYKQSVKAGNFTTKGQAISWMLARQDNITDVNHHLEIDKVIMTLLS
jgi:hypothetical protein